MGWWQDIKEYFWPSDGPQGDGPQLNEAQQESLEQQANQQEYNQEARAKEEGRPWPPDLTGV
jgi:hypothetical protein